MKSIHLAIQQDQLTGSRFVKSPQPFMRYGVMALWRGVSAKTTPRRQIVFPLPLI